MLIFHPCSLSFFFVEFFGRPSGDPLRKGFYGEFMMAVGNGRKNLFELLNWWYSNLATISSVNI